MSESWVRLVLPCKYYVAGDKLTGELFSSIYEKDTKIVLKVMGEEQVSIDSPNSKTNQSASIFTSYKEISDPSSPFLSPSSSHLKSVFPFTFHIPDYAPASFHFLDTDSLNNVVSAEVFYILEAELYYSGEILTKDTIEFTVYSKNYKEAFGKSSNSSTTRLKSCCCVSRGRSYISIELLGESEDNSERKFEVFIESANNKRLHSVIIQVVCDINLSVQDKNLFFRKVVNRKVVTPSILAFTTSGEKLNFWYGAKVESELIGPNVSTNKAKFFSCRYNIQALAMYNIGLHSTESECLLPLLVNPVPVINETPSFPSDWSAADHYFETPKVSSGSSYNTISDD